MRAFGITSAKTCEVLLGQYCYTIVPKENSIVALSHTANKSNRGIELVAVVDVKLDAATRRHACLDASVAQPAKASIFFSSTSTKQAV